MSTRRSFVRSGLSAATALILAPLCKDLSAQEADFTAAQMRKGGATAKLKVERLRDNVHMISGSGGNVLVLSGKDGLLAVDSGFATSRVQMQAALASVSAEPLRNVISTHWHFDHTDGNEWMHRSGAVITAYAGTLKRMQHQQVIPEFEAVFPPSPAAALPKVTFERTMSVHLNGNTIDLARYTPAHTDTDTSVFLRDADVLHTGDAFFHRLYPFIDYSSGGSINGMIAACRENLALVGKSTLVVCGHGADARRQDIVDFQDMLLDVTDRVQKLKRTGSSSNEVIASKPTAPFDLKWGAGFISPALFTSLVYRGV